MEVSDQSGTTRQKPCCKTIIAETSRSFVIIVMLIFVIVNIAFWMLSQANFDDLEDTVSQPQNIQSPILSNLQTLTNGLILFFLLYFLLFTFCFFLSFVCFFIFGKLKKKEITQTNKQNRGRHRLYTHTTITPSPKI